MTHYIKTVQPFFNDVAVGVKRFEVRKNDRDFKVGDILVLQEYDPEADTYIGGIVNAIITYILDDERYCKDGYVVIGFATL